MKIVSILGSPKKHGNTAMILEKVSTKLKGVADFEIIHITDYKINGCLGCSCCQQVLDKLGCIQKDDVEKLLHKLMDADVILYGTPLYGHSYSGQLKIFMDRHVALFKFVAGSDKSVNEMEILSFIEKKPVGLIVSCRGPEEYNTELIKQQFNKFCESSLANCIGTYIFPWCDETIKESNYSKATIQKIGDDICSVLEKIKIN